MAGAFQAADNIDTVGTLLNGAQQVPDINLPGTGNSNNFYVRRVLKSHRTCQVRG
jgi:hypothetical protein